jgi:alkanesulfonate monooxygenase SsuD/methylene tetrahydromethanopterin reductase-like flavin-dependent oxidoreductase (luciferase family)
MRERTTMYNSNKLKVGLFGANCSSGRAFTRVPERWSGSWPDCLRLGQMADDAGFDFMLPIGRWRGYGGETAYQDATLETITWATGLLAKTKRLTVFGTVHAPLLHSVIAAKAFVTADHIGEGRFGVNIVCGWNEDEFEMFGVAQRDHEARYDYAQEWIDAIKAMWSAEEEFDFDGQFIRLKNVRSNPKPYRGTRPILMNAGVSPTGQAFAIRNCDALFMGTRKGGIGQAAEKVATLQATARATGRELDVYTVGTVFCRPTRQEAEDYYRYCFEENADWPAVDKILAMRNVTPDRSSPADFDRIRRIQVEGMGGLPLIGTPDEIAQELVALSGAGITGIGISMVNYLAELPYVCSELLPRLERLGVRTPRG